MPVLEKSTYKAPNYYLNSGHLETILSSLFQKELDVTYQRERLTLSDGDFVDLDWIDNNSRQLVILSHGLEGDAYRPYIRRAAHFFTQHNWDVLAWNCRSCSGEMNRHFKLYNHGEIGDFQEVIAHALGQKDYEQVVLVGYSMGGSILMKYLGVNGKMVPEPIQCGIAFSAPCDLKSSVLVLEKPLNYLYKRRFFTRLKRKIEQKAAQFPEQISIDHFKSIKVWEDFDRYYSAPISGFDSPEEFYHHASAKNFMAGTQRPILLVNAQNDPILSPPCFPVELCAPHPLLHLEMPTNGGHVGFPLHQKAYSWAEERTWDFVQATA